VCVSLFNLKASGLEQSEKEGQNDQIEVQAATSFSSLRFSLVCSLFSQWFAGGSKLSHSCI